MVCSHGYWKIKPKKHVCVFSNKITEIVKNKKKNWLLKKEDNLFCLKK